jgi:Sec-independent protein translocase protein TatA
MSVFGIGPLELFFIVIIALIVLGPRDMVKAGKSIGRLMRRTIFSPTWLNVQNKVRNLPYELMREAGLEEEDLKIDPKQFNLGLESQAKALHETTAQFSKDVEKAIDVPSEWTASPALNSNPTSIDRSEPVVPAQDSSASGTERAWDPLPDTESPDKFEQPEAPKPETSDQKTNAQPTQQKQAEDVSQGEELI